MTGVNSGTAPELSLLCVKMTKMRGNVQIVYVTVKCIQNSTIKS